MLDDLSDVESGLEAKRTAQSSDVEASNRHLAQEDLEAYMEGRLSSARLKQCQTHLDDCEACRAELEDLRTFKSDLSGFARPDAYRGQPERRKRRRRLTLPVAAAAAIISIAAAVVWWAHQKPRPIRTSVAATVTHTDPPPPPATDSTPRSRPLATREMDSERSERTQTRDTRLADEISALPVDVRPAVSDAIQHGKFQLPTELSRFPGHGPSSVETPDPKTGFALLAPLGEAIAETRPEFRWQPLAGAIRYSVSIVDAGLHPVQRSHGLRTTHWRPRRPLRPGQTYLWQVTAKLRGGATLVASGPPQEAVLRIIPRKLANELAQFRKEHAAAHLVLGALYAQVGMLTESAAELRQVAPGDSSYATARTLLESLPSKL